MEFVLYVKVLRLRELPVKLVNFIRLHTTFAVFVYNAASQTLLNRLRVDVASVRVSFKQNWDKRYRCLCTRSGVASIWNVTYAIRRAVGFRSFQVFQYAYFDRSFSVPVSLGRILPNDRCTFRVVFDSDYFGNSVVMTSFAVAGCETRPTFHV